MPVPGAEAVVTALRATEKPTDAKSPYHAFSRCPPTALFGALRSTSLPPHSHSLLTAAAWVGAGKPPEWPGPEGEATTARLLWDDDALYICYECEGNTADAIDAVAPEVLSGMEGGAVPEAARSVLLDERVEAFVWPKGAQDHAGTPEADQHYFAFECNFAGVALTNKAQFGARMDFSWGCDAYSAAVSELAVGWGATLSPRSIGGPATWYNFSPQSAASCRPVSALVDSRTAATAARTSS